MRALTQLQRITRACARVRAAGLPRLAVLRDPTTGGGWATLGAGADITLAVRGAQVGFAGSRVRPTVATREAGAAYTAEGQFHSGHVDQLLDEEELVDTIARWLALLSNPSTEPADPPAALGAGQPPETGTEAVRRARAPSRPRARWYLDTYFDQRANLGDDGRDGTNASVLCGFGQRNGSTIAYVAQCGTATLPAGFRSAARLVRLAGRLGIPVLSIVDSPGAANDATAERDGVGPAIADLFTAMAELGSPATTLVIGEGGSGGALAFASHERIWVTPDSYFSVTSPEAAAILTDRASEEVGAIADQLSLRPQDVVELGIARGMVQARTV